MMVIETIKCEDCGAIVLIWSGQNRLCHNCKQKRFKAANARQELIRNAKNTTEATGPGGGLDKCI